MDKKSDELVPGSFGSTADSYPEEVDIVLGKTDRGFSYGMWTDRYGSVCSIQDSSLATEECIWLGVHTPFPGATGICRMHLTRAMAEALLPILHRFVETGSIKI